MVEILDEREGHALIQRDDGEVELVSWTPLNVLVYKHGLVGVLVDGTDTLELTKDGETARLEPNDDATEFYLTVESDMGDVTVHIPPHKKSALLGRLRTIYDTDDRLVGPLIDLAGDLMDTKVNPQVVDPLADKLIFDAVVEVTDDGWLFNDHLLLTYDLKFYHPNTDRTERSGAVLSDSANKEAYELNFSSRPDEDGQSALGDFNILSNDDETLEFIARAIWAATTAPKVPPE